MASQPSRTPALNVTAPSTAINTLTLAIDTRALTERNEVFAMEVIPAPGPDGIIPARDGRRQHIADFEGMLGVLNGEAVKARVDFDYRSEPSV